MAAPQLLERAEQLLARPWVPALINIAALALLAYTLAQGTWRLLTPAVAESPPAVAAGGDNAAPGLQALLDANLFGRAAAEASKPEPGISLDAIPPSSLNLTLTGVMLSARGSYALISAGSGPELPFGVGHEIAPGATLYAVYPDRVLIRRDGATESLMLKDIEASGGGGAPRGRARPAVGGPNRVIQSRSDGRFTIDREELTEQMQTPEFLTQALMVPNPGGGFLVREIQPGSLYEKLGLRVGDVITTVNGRAVNTVEDVMQLYSQFGGASNIQVQIQRGGSSETLVYNLQ